jgi:type IV pilus assembly protein PilE
MTTRAYRHRRRAPPRRGFTLIELLIVVTVVALLAMLAMPNYTESVQRAQRNNAKAALIRVAQFMERASTANGMYPVATLVPAEILAVDGKQYTIELVSTNGSSFTATATRVSGSRQGTDACGDFRINHTGNRTVLNAQAGMTAERCWGR